MAACLISHPKTGRFTNGPHPATPSAVSNSRRSPITRLAPSSRCASMRLPEHSGKQTTSAERLSRRRNVASWSSVMPIGWRASPREKAYRGLNG